MVITDDGDIGIGRTNPAAALDVNASSGTEPSIVTRGGNDYAATAGQYLDFGHWDGSTFTNRMRIDPTSGDVGIGTDAPSEKLDVDGTARLRGIPGGTVGVPVYVDTNGKLWKYTSSKRYKTGFEDLPEDPEAVLKLNPVRFQWKTTGEEDIGLIAEEVDEVLKDLVVYDNEGRPEAVKYDRVALYLLSTVKAQQERIAALEARLAALEQPSRHASVSQEGGAR